ncbi:hypothetical protein EV356DRAFT_455182, partial [Viridothelium virens]
ISGINFNKTFAPIIYYNSLRLLLCITLLYKYAAYLIDFNTAYLNNLLRKKIYA